MQILDNRPLSEQLEIIGLEWADANAAASLLEETKSAVLAQKIALLGDDIPMNRAENAIKASQVWHDHLAAIVDARKRANILKIKYEAIKARLQEWQSHEANHRLQARL